MSSRNAELLSERSGRISRSSQEWDMNNNGLSRVIRDTRIILSQVRLTNSKLLCYSRFRIRRAQKVILLKNFARSEWFQRRLLSWIRLISLLTLNVSKLSQNRLILLGRQSRWNIGRHGGTR